MGIGGAIAGVVGGLSQASAAKKASKAQQAAASQDLAFQKETRDLTRADLSPFKTAGTNALSAYNYLLGLGNAPTIGGTPSAIETIGGAQPGTQPGQSVGRVNALGGSVNGRDSPNPYASNQPVEQAEPTRYRVNGQIFNSMAEAQAYAAANPTGGTQYAGLETTPGYKFQFDQGTAGVNALAGAKGGLNSGATLQALNDYGQGMAQQYRDSYLNRLAGLSDMGVSAASMQGNANANAAAGVSNALSGIGNAKAAGAIGVGNAFSGMANNLLGTFQYQKAQQQPNTSGIGWGNWGF
jgi:hypothetical protein